MSAPQPSLPTEGPNWRMEWFRRMAFRTSILSGHPVAFGLALFLVVLWAATGPIFKYSDTWQLVINTGTTVVTFLMVFLIQATQNRDTAAIHLKLDELIRASERATDKAVAAEELSGQELQELKKEIHAKVETSDMASPSAIRDAQTPDAASEPANVSGRQNERSIRGHEPERRNLRK